MITPWLAFTLFVIVMLTLDLCIFHRKAHAIAFKEAVSWSVFWIMLALVFSGGIYLTLGEQAWTEFIAGYVIEKSLSVDNIFVFLTVFAHFKIPPRYQHRILFWGILGALVMRAAFIFAGTALLQSIHGLIYVFGAFLIYTAVKLLRNPEHEELDLDKAPVVRVFRRIIPMTSSLSAGRFITRENGKIVFTPLFLTLITVEISDVIFAIDSIPAILAITNDTFIVYTSNVFAIFGLRSLYFTIAGAVQSFTYLHYGLAGVLGFVGTKMLLSDIYKIPVAWALGVIAVLLTLSIAASLIAQRKKRGK